MCFGSSICPIEIWSSLTLRRISLGHYALRLITLPYAIRYKPCAILYGLRQVPPRCLVLADAGEAISRASCPSPYTICYMLYAICHFVMGSTYAPSKSGPRFAAEDFSGALCSPPYPICHTPLAIGYTLFLTGSDMCPFGTWSSLRCGGFLTGIMSSAITTH